MKKNRLGKRVVFSVNCLIMCLLMFGTLRSYGQTTLPEEFFKGLDLFDANRKAAKKELMISAEKAPDFYGSYHFLGVIYMLDNQIDSAISCYKKAIELNKENINHTKEMTYVRLIDIYLFSHDFSNAFTFAMEAYSLYPQNTVIDRGIKDVCLWSFYTKFNELSLSYLSQDLKDEYLVNSVAEEYLIVRKIRINEKYLSVVSQSLVTKKKASYDILTCVLSKSKEKVDVKFKLNWDLEKDFGGKTVDYKSIYADTNNTVYERIGALLVMDPKIDLKIEIEKIQRK